MASTATNTEEFVIHSEEPLPLSPSDTISKQLPVYSSEPGASNTNITTKDLSLDIGSHASRIDSFPKSLPLPASSVLSPTSALEQQQNFDYSTEQREPLAQDTALQAGAQDGYEEKASTPLAELPATKFDLEVAAIRKSGSVVGEELDERLAELELEEGKEDEEEAEESKENKQNIAPEVLAARKQDPALLDSLPVTPSAEDYEVAEDRDGPQFNPEFPIETKVAS